MVITTAQGEESFLVSIISETVPQEFDSLYGPVESLIENYYPLIVLGLIIITIVNFVRAKYFGRIKVQCPGSEVVSISKGTSILEASQIAKIPSVLIVLLVSSIAYAGASHDHYVSIAEYDSQRCFTTNSIPDHSAGPFRNGTVVKPKLLKLCVTTSPQRRAQPSKLAGAMGIGLNGIQFKPMTSGYFDPNTSRGHSREGDKDWSFDIAGAPNQRGLDSNNAHVGKVDSYHYHGLPMALIKKQAGKKSTLIGYAADGFEIYYVGDAARSSYQLKQGKRPTKISSGNYDGTYNEDYVFVEGKGNLDQCNMGQLNDKLVYFLTHDYPFVPRCLWGEASKDFVRERGSRNQ